MGRSPLTVAAHPAPPRPGRWLRRDLVTSGARAGCGRAAVDREAVRSGQTIAQVAGQYGWSRSAIWHVVLDARIQRLVRRKVKFIDDPLYHQPDAEAVVDAMAGMEGLGDAEPSAEAPVPRGIPSHLARLCQAPLLTARPRAGAVPEVQLPQVPVRGSAEAPGPELARRRDLDRLEAHLASATAVKNAILRATFAWSSAWPAAPAAGAVAAGTGQRRQPGADARRRGFDIHKATDSAPMRPLR